MKFERSFFTFAWPRVQRLNRWSSLRYDHRLLSRTRRVAWLHFKLEFSNEKCEMENQLRRPTYKSSANTGAVFHMFVSAKVFNDRESQSLVKTVGVVVKHKDHVSQKLVSLTGLLYESP